MCNAHNHPPNCPCGWGEGINFSFSSKFYSQYSQFKTDYFEKVMDVFPPSQFSITIPNAICPKCGAKVYFYQNHYGSRVYFDSLGTPWPKHPCTDTKDYSTKHKKEFDFSDKEFYTIPKQNLTDYTLSENSNLKNIIHSIYLNRFNRKLFSVDNKEYLLLEEFNNSPDIMILTKREDSLFLETFEIFNDSYQIIPLLAKENADSINIKHFIIEKDDILFIKINHSKYQGNNNHVYIVDLINFDIFYEMRLENFLTHKRENIRLCKYLWNDEFKKFKVKLIDGELYEV